MRILVLGRGQVASAVIAAAPMGHEVVVRGRRELDITDAEAVVRTFEDVKADWVINGAAYTAVDRAEDELSHARAVNERAVATLADGAVREGSRLLHLSTDFVFDGVSGRAYLPTDSTNPLNVYGATKLAGEHHVIASRTGIVLRTSWVYASVGQNFVLTMLKVMREREQVNVVCDQIGTPTWAMSAAEAIWGLIDASAQGGVYHWSDLGVASWYDFAVAIQEEALERGLLSRASRVVPIPTASYPTRAKRPAFSVLDTAATRKMISIPGRHWRRNLRKMLDEIRTT